MMTVGIPKTIDARTAVLLELRNWLDFEVLVSPVAGAICRGMVESKTYFRNAGPPLMSATVLEHKLNKLLGEELS